MSVNEEFTELLRYIIINDINFLENQLIKLYGLYKQSIYGDNNTNEPNFLFLKDNLIWREWSKHIGKDKEICKKEFIDYYKFIKTI